MVFRAVVQPGEQAAAQTGIANIAQEQLRIYASAWMERESRDGYLFFQYSSLSSRL